MLRGLVQFREADLGALSLGSKTFFCLSDAPAGIIPGLPELPSKDARVERHLTRGVLLPV